MHTHRTLVRTACDGSFVVLSLLSSRLHAASQSIDFVAEHLPEIAMDIRYASLPRWASIDGASPAAWRLANQGGYAQTQADTLRLAGSMISLTLVRQIDGACKRSAFEFIDDFSLSSGAER